MLPIDNLLKPRRKYAGDYLHKIALQQQHRSFLLVHQRLKKEKKRQAKYADKKFQIGDPVYHKNHRKTSKLQNNRKPYYRIIDQITPVTFIIKNKLDGTTVQSHAEHLRLAKLDWEISQDAKEKALRKPAYVVPPNTESDSESNSEGEAPLPKIIKKYRRERDNSSSDEEHIPLAELSRRSKQQQI